MKRYELLERTAEIKDKGAIKPGCTVDVALSTPGYDDEPITIKSFTSLEEAKEELDHYKTSVRKMSGHDGK